MSSGVSGGHFPVREPTESVLRTFVSAAITATLLMILWPPTGVYWHAVAAVVGETVTLAVVVSVAAGAGTWFARTSGYGLPPITVGIALAYATGMLGIEAGLAPASPTHLLWYGVLAGAILCGALIWWVAVQL